MRILFYLFALLLPCSIFANSAEDIVNHELAKVKVYQMKLSPVPYSSALQLSFRTDHGLKTFIVAREDMPSVLRALDQVHVPLQASNQLAAHFSQPQHLHQPNAPVKASAHANAWINSHVTAANQQASK